MTDTTAPSPLPGINPFNLTGRTALLTGGSKSLLLLCFVCSGGFCAEPPLLDDRFELPPGFHIYRAAEPELSGGSYDVAFDGDGRLLVGDGSAVRRLQDADSDGVYDRFEVIATGLGSRGPQGLQVWGDRLYAVGDDGLQLFEGYRSGTLVHRGRLGEKFRTGGDHDLHTVFRGPDGWLYLMAGNGAGIEGRRHITEATSPMLRERQASVFRLDPDGQKWECLATGGRNPPSLAMHHTGELFSFDSDMEWHVGLPFYKPVRLSHWAIGADLGWEDVGALPPYFIDCVPHVMAAGRGSPNWGVFYDHAQFPGRWRHALINCDYRWKSESGGDYNSSGRLVAFFLQRDGAGWKAQMEILARPRPGARDGQNRPVNFALVDIEVAPDGSLLVSDHNQGLWRIFYDATPANPKVPGLVPPPAPLPADKKDLTTALLRLPQPLAEWSRLRAEHIRAAHGDPAALTTELQRIALDANAASDDRRRAIHLLAPEVARLDEAWLPRLAADPSPELRGQAAWLLGLHLTVQSETHLLTLLADADALVRRRAAESLSRSRSPRVVPALIERLGDASRLTRFIAMNALGHHPAESWLDKALADPRPPVRMRALVACLRSQQSLPPQDVRRALGELLRDVPATAASELVEDQLDLLRVLTLFKESIEPDAELRRAVEAHLLSGFPPADRNLRWEQARLLGLFAVERGFTPLLDQLLGERDEVTQFHLAQALSRLPRGWSEADEARAVEWFLGTQRGWFAETRSKGVEFQQFWAATVSGFVSHHPDAVLRNAEKVDAASSFGAAFVDLIATRDPTGQGLIALYQKQPAADARRRIALAFRRTRHPPAAAFLRGEISNTPDAAVLNALWQALAAQPVEAANVPQLTGGLTRGEPDTAKACADALTKHRPAPDVALAEACLDRMAAGSPVFHGAESLLVSVSHRQRPDYKPDADSRRGPNDAARQAAIAWWSEWFVAEFGRPYVSKSGRTRSDETIHQFLLGESIRGGDAVRGGTIYERLACHTCHGGGAAPGREGRLFGPDLAGVTRRLTRTEFADSLVYPSKQVADRFKIVQVEKKDGTVLAGFITEKTADAVTFADMAQVHRIPTADVVRMAPQPNSVMPAGLLSTLSDEEIRDLLAFMENIGVAGGK